MESIKNNLFTSNTCHRIIPSKIPNTINEKSIQERITFINEVDGKTQSSFDEAFIIEVPGIETAKKISTFWKHQKYLANIQTSAFFGACMTSVLLVSKAILLPYSLIAAITFVASGVFALSKKRNAQQQLQLYSSPTIAYAKELDQTRQKLLKATFTELCQKAKNDTFVKLINEVLHPKEVQSLFRQDLEKLSEIANSLDPFEISKNGETELPFFKIFFASTIFSEKALEIALIPTEKASYITKNFSKLLSEYKACNLLMPAKTNDEKTQKLKTICYLKKEIESFLDYTNQKELFTSTLGKSYSNSQKLHEQSLLEKKWQHVKNTFSDIKQTFYDGKQFTTLFCSKAKKHSETCLDFLNKNAKLFKAKTYDFYKKESKRLEPHAEKLKNEIILVANLVKVVTEKKLKEEFLAIKQTLNRDSLFSNQ